MFIVDRVLGWIVRQVKRQTPSERKQACILVLLLLLYLHCYFFVVIKPTGSLYDQLELTHRATHNQIRSKGRRILAATHPDRVSNSEKKYMEIEEALTVLGNKSGKWLYDRFRIPKEKFIDGRFTNQTRLRSVFLGHWSLHGKHRVADFGDLHGTGSQELPI